MGSIWASTWGVWRARALQIISTGTSSPAGTAIPTSCRFSPMCASSRRACKSFTNAFAPRYPRRWVKNKKVTCVTIVPGKVESTQLFNGGASRMADEPENEEGEVVGQAGESKAERLAVIAAQAAVCTACGLA